VQPSCLPCYSVIYNSGVSLPTTIHDDHDYTIIILIILHFKIAMNDPELGRKKYHLKNSAECLTHDSKWNKAFLIFKGI
jgi:hypothetical protein